ncbi:CDP-glucose 4,6-dehydratase [Desulfonatronovibrio magnus]|uniref:CDP-glucose 4,6-dehydratase n=1 Tax=Desulfonatronovibrio magnus TaxID=698827 RepID=UPI0005EB94EC|nr:CDP-glucose 4,6-dehydratase [Desulfonatronovibrio magnus]
MSQLFNDIFRSRKVLITGHTGFKGSWLAFWLIQLGADVTGFALEPDTDPSHFKLLNLPMRSIIGDIRDPQALAGAVQKSQPEIVFHLAAQPLVRRSYREPVETFASNVMGTIHLFEASRKIESVRAIVNITSDKCYENQEWIWGYRENDPMGGHDPYSASKGCAELVTSSWRNSFFHPDQYEKSHQVLLASARAGNVIGGGDWGEDRLIPDIMRATVANKPVIIRNPQATRPWQHVLEPLSGYLLLGQKLLDGRKELAQAWNFGPSDADTITVGEVVRRIKKHWNAFDYVLRPNPDEPHEANLLRLDCSKARVELGWETVWDSETTFIKTIEWYKFFYENNELRTAKALDEYEEILMTVQNACK